MIVAAFDPSSTRTGFALARVEGSRVTIVERGAIDPGDLPDAKGPKGGRLRVDAERRLDALCDEVSALLREWARHGGRDFPEVILIEAPRKPRPGSHRAESGMWIFGRAVGVVEAALRVAIAACGRSETTRVERVDPNDWTRIGGKNWSKGQRLALLRAVDPGYDQRNDPGGDIGDACMLLLLWAKGQEARQGEARR